VPVLKKIIHSREDPIAEHFLQARLEVRPFLGLACAWLRHYAPNHAIPITQFDGFTCAQQGL
jgi:hypothetical protein